VSSPYEITMPYATIFYVWHYLKSVANQTQCPEILLGIEHIDVNDEFTAFMVNHSL
jgi:hypothetical protein